MTVSLMTLKSDTLLMASYGDVDDHYDYSDDDTVNLGESLKFSKFFFSVISFDP